MKTELSRFLKSWREKNEYSQKELGKILKCSSQQISNIERGVHLRPVTFCKRVLKFMNNTDKREMKNALYKTLLEKINEIFV
jgi:transcriptional regulator with XRE-family HTH domain